MNEIDFRTMDLNLLKVFEALHEEGGAGRAAIRLGLTQSAVSAALGRLRTLYADPLFARTGRGLRPTAKALELRPVIAEALDRCRHSLALATQQANLGGRTLTLGLSDDYEIAYGFTLASRVQAQLPGLRLILRQTHSLLANDMLMAREIDLSLSAGGIVSRTLGRQVLGTGNYACVVDPDHAPADALTLDEYLRRDHVLVSSGGFIGVVDEALSTLQRSRHVRVSTTHFAALPHLLLGSDAVATLPRHAAQALARVTRLRCMECPVPMPQYSIELGWRLESQRDPTLQQLKAQVVSLFR
ncbi:LysR family transcriptional regulator [Pseudomonas sp. H9]|uniref:LysR family transcriptional regulator n=1 Tax=Pseudomonas sp. H9 TaxID=483968 RepID=UPI0010579054|nr:LysR family transcriptional regulator [Pseudomonas sp. H9]TDF82319.1 LysR family transcriptional regulator [Pseudomonas sp. H9]